MNSVIDSWEMDPPRDPQPSSTKPTRNVAVEDSDGEEVDCRRPLVKEITEEDLQNFSNSLVVLSGYEEVSEYEEVPEEEVREERPLLYKAITPEIAFKAAQRIVVLTEYSEILESNTASTSRRISHQSTGTGGSRSCCASLKPKRSSTTTGRTTDDTLVKESKAKTQLDRKRKSSSHESKESTSPSGSQHRPRCSCTNTNSAEEKDQHDSDSSGSRSPTRKKRQNAPKSSRRQSEKFSQTTRKASSEEISANDALPECQTVVTMMDTPLSTPCGIKTGVVCQNKSAAEYPCRRCHREYYCSVEHQIADANRHKPFCKVDAQLELMPFNNEYSTWLAYSAPLLYKKCLNFVLVWPSLTVEWLTDAVIPGPQLLLGTNTGNSEPNHLLICGVDMKKDDPFEGEFRVLKRIIHKGQVNRARHMPHDSSIIATIAPSKDVAIFYLHDFPDLPETDEFRPSLLLRGHSEGGFGLAWNTIEESKLASGSNDGMICIWDIRANPDTTAEPTVYLASPGSVGAVSKYSNHTSVVEDMSWSYVQPSLLASCGDDKKLIVWDIRNKTHALTKENAHDGDINSVDLSPFSEYAVLTGGSDQVVKLWDTRQLDEPVLRIEPFNDCVMNVKFSSLNSLKFASAGNEKIYIMDMTRTPASPSNEVSMPKECEFIHSGHVFPVNEISWNSDGMMASVSGDNILQVWEHTH